MGRGAFIYGRKPVLELLQDGQQAERIFIQRGVDRTFIHEIRELAGPLGVPVNVVPRQKMARITRKNHQGVIAFTSVVEYGDLLGLVNLAFERGETPLVVILDGVTDVRNLGAIARSAEVFGSTALVLPMRGAAMINEDAVKTSAGAIRRLDVARVESIPEACVQLQEMGVRVCVADHGAEHLLADIDMTGPVAIVMGAEDAGVEVAVRKLATETFSIPQRGQTDSLNVSVAAGVILYEVTRQRKTL